MNSKQCELLDHPRLLAQFAGLQRRTGRSGRDSIDHRPNQRDDLASSVAGAAVGAVMSAGRKGPCRPNSPCVRIHSEWRAARSSAAHRSRTTRCVGANVRG